MAEKIGSTAEGEKKELQTLRTAETEECRCEEAKGKSISEMLRLVLEDLAFWRKRKDLSPENSATCN